MPPKRPLGLAKSKARKSSNAVEPDAKRLKSSTGENDTTEAQSLTEEWDDLQELLARAVKAFGLESAGSLPLFRGVLHECDRITRNYSEESIAQLSTGNSTSEPQPIDRHANFYALFADALIHSGVIIGRSPDLIMEDEPDTAEAYFRAAKDLFDKNLRSKQGSFDDVRSQVTWGSTLLLLADVKAGDIPRSAEDQKAEYEEDDEEEDDEKDEAAKTNANPDGPKGADSDEGKEVTELLKEGITHYTKAFDICPEKLPSTAAQSADTKENASSPAETEDLPILPHLSRTWIATSLATQLLDIAEDQLPRSMRPSWLLEVKNAIAKAESCAEANDLSVQAGISKALGRYQLASFALALPPNWEDLDELSGLPGGDEASKLAQEAVDSLEKANDITANGPFTSTLQLSFDADDLAERLHYAYTIMINLETEDEIIEAWVQKSSALGFGGDESDDDDDEEIEEGEGD